MPEFSDDQQRELAARILQRTEALDTNCAEVLRLPYRAQHRIRPLFVLVALASVAGVLVTGVYLVGIPAERAARSSSGHGGNTLIGTSEQQALISNDPVSCFFRGLHRVLG